MSCYLRQFKHFTVADGIAHRYKTNIVPIHLKKRGYYYVPLHTERVSWIIAVFDLGFHLYNKKQRLYKSRVS